MVHPVWELRFKRLVILKHIAKLGSSSPDIDEFCDTRVEEAVEDLRQGRTNPLASEMRDANEPWSPAYPCLTQKGDEPTFAAPPDASDQNLPSIVLGLGTVVPRWGTSVSHPTTLKWFVDAAKFPTAAEAGAAAEALDQAAEEWNGVAFGVTVVQTTEKKEANFNLAYRGNPPGRPRTLARGFFPHQADRDIVVFKYGMDPSNASRLKNVFLHELGHVFGLRHEFAIEKEQQGAKLFMTANKDSVMEYNKVPMIQETDKEGIREFYKLPNGSDVDGSPVTDYIPQLRSINQTDP